MKNANKLRREGKKSKIASQLQRSKMMPRVNWKAKMLVSAKSKMTVNAIDKSVGDDVDVDVETPSFPNAYDT